MPKDCILLATSLPILPSPTIPRVLPKSSAPMNWNVTKSFWLLGTQKLHRFHYQVESLTAGGDGGQWDESCNSNCLMHQPNSLHTNQILGLLFCDPIFQLSLTSQPVGHVCNHKVWITKVRERSGLLSRHSSSPETKSESPLVFKRNKTPSLTWRDW